MAQDPSSPDLPAPAPSPLGEGVLSADRLESLRDHLEQLQDELRRCFLLRYGRGYGEDEIAILMKLPADRVRACLAEARQRLGFGSDGEVF